MDRAAERTSTATTATKITPSVPLRPVAGGRHARVAEWVEARQCCAWSGLRFPDGGRRCHRHATEEDVRLVDELDNLAPAAGLRSTRDASLGGRFSWPYGPNVDVPARAAMLAWAVPAGLKLARRQHACLTWLRTGRCTSFQCRTTSEAWWMDHVTAWTDRDGAPAVLVAQPYVLSPQDVDELDALARGGLTVEVRAEGSWYGHGTWFIAVRREVAPS